MVGRIELRKCDTPARCAPPRCSGERGGQKRHGRAQSYFINTALKIEWNLIGRRHYAQSMPCAWRPMEPLSLHVAWGRENYAHSSAHTLNTKLCVTSQCFLTPSRKLFPLTLAGQRLKYVCVCKNTGGVEPILRAQHLSFFVSKTELHCI